MLAEREAREANAQFEAFVKECGIEENEKEYFSFLLEKELSSLNEDEELSEESVDAIIKKTKAINSPASTTITEGEAEKTPTSVIDRDMTLEKFMTLSMMERSQLYGEEPKIYEKFLAAEKLKKGCRF